MQAPPTCLATGDNTRRGMEYNFNNMAPLRVADVLLNMAAVIHCTYS